MRPDILSSLIAARDADGSHFTEKELIDQIAVMFLAGHETSASALSWALYLIARDRDVQDRMHLETDKAFGQEGGLQPRHFRHLKLTRDVFRETLRLYPPVSFIPRDITVPRKSAASNVKKGSAIFISLWLMHRHRVFGKTPTRSIRTAFRAKTSANNPPGLYTLQPRTAGLPGRFFRLAGIGDHTVAVGPPLRNQSGRRPCAQAHCAANAPIRKRHPASTETSQGAGGGPAKPIKGTNIPQTGCHQYKKMLVYGHETGIRRH